MSDPPPTPKPGAQHPLAGVVTLLFTDIEGSTRLARRLGAVRWRETISDHHALIGEAIAANGGHVDHTEGDAFVALFRDAPAAVLAAAEAQRRLAAHRWPEGVGSLRVRMGLHTGTVEPHSTGYLGLDAHLAARVVASANGGQILITSATRRAAGDAIEARDLGEHRLKDFPEPERLHHVVVDGLDDAPVLAPRTESVRPTNLPPRTRALIGRERERAELSELLTAGTAPIVTLTGIGGIGKTLLALAVARDLLEHAPGGVFVIRLAGIADPGSIVPMIAEAIGITGEPDEPLERLVAERLGAQRTVLLLDNFEQVVSGAAIVANLITEAGGLRMLVTSQVPLRVGGERTFPLGPLADTDAVDLFVERARAVVPAFEPTGDERDAIKDICVRLDWMPLAIELAAARVGSLGPRALERRLERPLELLTRGDRDLPERHRSLRATIEWTHALLDPGQQALLARLGVCSGAVPLGMVEALAGAEEGWQKTLDRLEGLLELSLVGRQEDRRLGIRFYVPQALREFALERLVEAGEENDVRRRHAAHVATLAHAARLWKWGASAEQRCDLLAAADEIRPAVAWARDHDPELHVRLCAALSWYWVTRGVISETTEQLRQAHDSGAGSAVDRAWTTTLLAKSLQIEGARDEAVAVADQALAEWRQVDDDRERGLALGPASWVYRWASRLEEAVALAEEGLAILRHTRDRTLILRGLVFLAHALVDTDRLLEAETVLEEAEQLAGEDPVWELAAIRGDCALSRGDNPAAARFYAKNLAWTSESGESHQMLMDLRALTISLARAGYGEAALEVHELTRLHEERTGRVGDIAGVAEWFEQAAARARELIGPEPSRAVIARAAKIPPAQRNARAIELAAEVPDLATTNQKLAGFSGLGRDEGSAPWIQDSS